MLPWRVSFDTKAGVHRHVTASGFGHALLVPILANAFEFLGIAVTLWDGREWLPIHEEPMTVTRFEIEHRLGSERAAYNERCFAQARRTQKPVRGTHSGFMDLFVPIVVGEARRQRRAKASMVGVLVAGPFLATAPTSAELLTRWQRLTGHGGHTSDPEFSLYLRVWLSSLVLDEGRISKLERLLGCFAELMAGQVVADTLMNEATTLRKDLEEARFVERMWDTARAMIDDRSPRGLYSDVHAFELRKLGLTRIVDHALVGLLRSNSKTRDPVDEAVRRAAFQRSSVALAREMGDVLAGQVGEHGVVFLSGTAGTLERKRRKLADIAQRALTLARRRYELAVHFGACHAPASVPLVHSYETALGAAESALSEGARLVFSEKGPSRVGHALRHLRAGLSRAVDEDLALLTARFDRYLEALAIHTGHRVESARVHLEVGFETLTQPLVERGALEEKSFEDVLRSLDAGATAARTLDELFAVYRQAVADVSEAIQHPGSADRQRSLRRAIEYIRRHYAEPVRLNDVARVAGFTPSHFSKLFIKREQTPFESYLRSLRLERARELLSTTELAVARISELCGFASTQYFCRVFKRVLGATPATFRRRQRRLAGIKLSITSG